MISTEREGEPVIAVELDPPESNAQGDALRFLTEGTHRLSEAGASFVTMADNPCARQRGDSLALAALVTLATGVPVMPHLAGRDRTAFSIGSSLLALDMAGIHDVLLVTGDRHSRENRAAKGVSHQFNAIELARHIRDTYRDTLSRPFRLSAALNINARNFQAELSRSDKKIDAGVSRFLTQPVLSERALENLAEARAHFSQRQVPPEVLAGILPVVSHRNALFLQQGIPGVYIEDSLVASYAGLDRQGARQQAVRISLNFASRALRLARGLYIITPFKQVDLSADIVRSLRAAETQTCRAGEKRSIMAAS